MRLFCDDWPVDQYTLTGGRFVTDESTVIGATSEVELADFRLPGHHGRVLAGPLTHDAAVYTVAVHLWGALYDDAARQIAELNRRFQPRNRPVLLRREFATFATQAAARVVQFGGATSIEPGNRSLDATWQFSLPQGRWYDTLTQTVALTAGAQAVTALAGGSAPTEATFRITGNGASTRLMVTDQASGAWFDWQGQANPGTVILIDPLRYTATVNGADRRADLTVGDEPFYLSPDAEVTVTVSSAQPAQLTAARAWLE